MAYEINPSSSPARELRRVAQEQAAKATGELETLGLREAAHAARKRMKKIRALLRLFRPELGDLYRQENVRFRDAARTLAPVRDATTRLEALDALEGWAHERFVPVRRRLEALREQVEREAVNAETIARAQQALATAQTAIPTWRLEQPPDGLPGGIDRTYRRGCDALDECRRSPEPKNLHEWRKRAKYHRYHCRLLEPIWEAPLEAREDEAHQLTDLLGEHHDLSELDAAIRAEQGSLSGVGERLLARSAQRRSELEGSALRLGAKLYAEKPKAVLRRMRLYWRLARS